MINLYAIRNTKTGYTGQIINAESDGSLISQFTHVFSNSPVDNFVLTMLNESVIYCLGSFDSDTMAISPCEPRLVSDMRRFIPAAEEGCGTDAES